MNRFLPAIALMICAVLPSRVFAQGGSGDDNFPPVIVDWTFQIAENISGVPSGSFGGIFGGIFFNPGANYLPFRPFDPQVEVADELDLILASVTVFDADFDEADGEGAFFLTTSTWCPIPFFPSPEPPPIAEDSLTFFPMEEGLKPSDGTQFLTYSYIFQIPPFQGKNQARLRGDVLDPDRPGGIVDYDVRYLLAILVSNEQDPGCGVQQDGDNCNIDLNFEECENPVAIDLQPLYCKENPVIPPPNGPPFADAGADQRVASGNLVKLDGSRTFDSYNVGFNAGSPNIIEKDTLTFTWEWVSGPVRVDPTQSVATDPKATVRLTALGTYVYRLLVDDGFNALPATDSVSIEVLATLPENNPPVAVIRGPAGPVAAGTVVTLDGRESSDPDSDTLTFRWRQTNELGEDIALDDLRDVYQPLSGVSTNVVTWQTSAPGSYFFRLLVDDGIEQASTTFSVTVAANAAAAAQVASTEEDVPTDANARESSADDNTPTIATPMAACGAGLMPLAIVPLILAARKRRS